MKINLKRSVVYNTTKWKVHPLLLSYPVLNVPSTVESLQNCLLDILKTNQEENERCED